jgi:hypothetical protein
LVHSTSSDISRGVSNGLAVAKQVTVQLADMVLAERDRTVRVDDEIDGLGVARDLLLIARGETADADPAEKRLDLVVGERAALDARGRADALDGGDLAERVQPVGRKRARCPPGAAELLDAGQEPQHAGGELGRSGREHSHIDIQI